MPQDVLVQFSPDNAIIGVAGYYVSNEGTQHVIVGFRDGTLTEVYWKSPACHRWDPCR